MNRTRIAGLSAAVLLAVMVIGCQQPKVDMAEMMKPPPRPVELDRLDMFVGSWQDEAKITLPGVEEVTESTGSSRAEWAADKWVLVEHYEYEMDEGHMMRGVHIWTWDAKAKKYRISSFNSYGGTGTGTATYDEEAGTWHLKGKDHSGKTGKTTVGEGTVTEVDNNTLEWQFTEWNAWKLKKLMEGEGTSRRK